MPPEPSQHGMHRSNNPRNRLHPDYHRPMAVIHISEAEAARDLPSLLAKVRAGEEIRIDSGSETYALTWTSNDQPRKLTDVLASIRRHAEEAGLDDGFADDVEDGMRLHRMEQRTDPWA